MRTALHVAHVSAVSDLILNNFKRFPIGVGPEEEDFDFGRGEDPVGVLQKYRNQRFRFFANITFGSFLN